MRQGKIKTLAPAHSPELSGDKSYKTVRGRMIRFTEMQIITANNKFKRKDRF